MPKQNRVTPYGELIATPARGTLMGNRGCLHNSRQQVVRHHRGKRWITCVLQFKDRHRAIMTPGHYTELFFLDEATALAAGHRPCAECSRSRFELFRTLWAGANPDLTDKSAPRAGEIDETLHRDRITTTEQNFFRNRFAILSSRLIIPSERLPLSGNYSHFVTERLQG